MGLPRTPPALFSSSIASAVPKKCSVSDTAVAPLREKRTPTRHVTISRRFLVRALRFSLYRRSTDASISTVLQWLQHCSERAIIAMGFYAGSDVVLHAAHAARPYLHWPALFA